MPLVAKEKNYLTKEKNYVNVTKEKNYVNDPAVSIQLLWVGQSSIWRMHSFLFKQEILSPPSILSMYPGPRHVRKERE